MSRVLLTGATGFIGSHALEALAARGHAVHAVTSGSPPPDAPGEWHTADLLDSGVAGEVVRAAGAGHLLHLAWYAEPGKYWTSEENVRWVEATLRLLRAFYEAGGRRAVVAGTCAEYDWSHALLSEGSTPLCPATLYGQSKVEAFEQGSELAGELGAGLAWGRVFFLYGPREHPGRLVSSVARSLLAGEEAPTSKGSQVRDFMHVEDVASAFVALLESGATGAVNIGSGVPVTVRAVVEEVARATGRPELLRIGALPQRPGEPPELVADVSRLRDEIGFRPRYDLTTGVGQTVEWWRHGGFAPSPAAPAPP